MKVRYIFLNQTVPNYLYNQHWGGVGWGGAGRGDSFFISMGAMEKVTF